MSEGGQLFPPVGLKGEQREDIGSAGILTTCGRHTAFLTVSIVGHE